jgi:hypothetical protein
VSKEEKKHILACEIKNYEFFKVRKKETCVSILFSISFYTSYSNMLAWAFNKGVFIGEIGL